MDVPGEGGPEAPSDVPGAVTGLKDLSSFVLQEHSARPVLRCVHEVALHMTLGFICAPIENIERL